MSEPIETSAPSAQRPHALMARTTIGMAWLFAWRMATRLLGFVSTLTLARLLTPADYGLVAMATAFSWMVDALSELGLQDALVRRVGEGQRLFDVAFTLQLVRAGVTALILTAASPVISKLYDEPRLLPLLLCLAATSLITGLENVGISEFRREMKYDVLFRLLLVPRVLGFATTIGYALIYRTYWALLIGIVVSKATRTVMTYVVHPHRSRLTFAGWRVLFGFSFWTWANSCVGVIWERLESFVVGPLFGARALGVYTVAAEIATLPVSELIFPTADVLFAAFAVAQKGGVRSIRYAPIVAVALMMCVIPIAIGISVGAGPIVMILLGPAWADAVPLTAILAWLSIFSPISFICNAALVANNLVHRTFVARVVSAGVKLVAVLACVSSSSELTVLATVVTVCVAIESIAYLSLLLGTDDLELRVALTAGARALMGGGVVLAGLVGLGLAWQPAADTIVACVFQCLEIGAVALVLYVPALAMLWWLSGRPAGPEHLLLVALRPWIMRTIASTRRMAYWLKI